MTKQWKLYFVLALVQILFGINFVVSKVIVEKIPPILWAELRFLSSGLILLAILFSLKYKIPKLQKEDWISIFFLGFIGFTTGQSLLLQGIKFSTAGHAAILSSTIPLFALLISIFRKQESLSFLKGMGFILSFLGILVIQNIEKTNFQSQGLVGDLLILISCLGVGAYLSLGKSFFKRVDPLWATAFFFLMASAQLLPFALHEAYFIKTLSYSLNLIGAAFYSIIGATVLAYFLSNWVLSKLPSGPVALFTYLQPITAIFFSVTFLGEVLTSRVLLGTLLVFIGFFCTIKKQSKTF